MIQKKEIENFYPKSQAEWRLWLSENHVTADAVWLIYYKKKTNQPSITWSVAVDEALCFGWIDSVHKTLDEERSIQFFTKRKPKSMWSRVNKQKIELLVTQGLMTQAGLDCIEIAKKNGSWTILDDVEDLKIPEDFAAELTAQTVMDNFLSLGKSDKKMMLHRVTLAKRPETRQKYIAEAIVFIQQKNSEKTK